MTTYLTDYLADGKNIPDSEREVIRYGVEGILNNLLGIFITVMLVSFVIVYLKVACFGFPFGHCESMQVDFMRRQNFDV